ncbi:YaaC family protein [Chitinophaga rhizophila]|uniref:YaaC family protein n=1 Tax=Chitinophaga rhizophila TaxID=2866212 RepID=A0ABS7G7D5_9BACT|nr:YaaC family protein [Chitinophaga rhizophila]MBW8683554.1 YaaC family protein [Chitinophaga rhizophila]
MSSASDRLIDFQTRDLVTKFIKKRHNRNASARSVREITSSFIQGREYFNSAEKADLTVKPLLLYYGVLAYSRGLILANNVLLSEASLKPSHGLEIKNWSYAFKDMNFYDLEITTTEGTLKELLDSTDNTSYLKSRSLRKNMAIQYKLPSSGVKLKLGDLLRTFPDIGKEFEGWTEKKLIYYQIDHFETIGDQQKIVSNSPISQEELELLVPQSASVEIRPNKGHGFTILTANDSFPSVVQKWEEYNNIREMVIVQPANKDIHFNTISSFYMVAYAFGMMARYFPSTWISLSRSEKGDAIYPLVLKTLRLIQELYPQLVLDHLNVDDFWVTP